MHDHEVFDSFSVCGRYGVMRFERDHFIVEKDFNDVQELSKVDE